MQQNVMKGVAERAPHARDQARDHGPPTVRRTKGAEAPARHLRALNKAGTPRPRPSP
jgi:hypothetical protein